MSHLLSFSLLFFCFFISIAAQSIQTNYPTCPSYKCGHLNISYPFWRIDDDQPQFCGYQGLGISCFNINGTDRPIINFDRVPYFVEKIISEATYHRIVLVDYEVSSIFPIVDRIYCPAVRRNIYFQLLPINFTPSNIDVSFHFNCNRVPSFATEIPCLESDSGRRKSCFNRPDKEPEDFDWSNYSCDENVVKKVLRNPALPDGGDRLETDYLGVLSRGFELQYWGRMENCDTCEISGGRCGYNNSTAESMCFCSDGRTTTDNCKTKGINWGLILAIGFGSGVTILSLMLVFKIYCIVNSPSSICISSFKHKTEDEKRVEAFITQYGSLGMKRYSYGDIKKMTNSFEVELGKGGFGTVFKGKLSDGRLVAVKVLNSSKANGQEFINEVASIGSTSHVNIVSLLGFCFEYKKRSLVYEFMPNGSLDKFIIRRVPLEISERIGVDKLHEVALGIARGLDYLHRGCNTRILHLDIKPHNILLDEDLRPKIADFGLAKLYSRKESVVSMLEARGTIGYIAPEVFNRNFGRVSHKSDVYSYGMLILEMVGGRKNDDIDVSFENTSEIYFPDWIYNRLKMDEFLLDGVRTIEENEYARKMVIVGLWCIQNNPTQRPSINEVIEMLEGSMEALRIPPKPLFNSPPRYQLTTFNISPEVSQDDCILVTT